MGEELKFDPTTFKSDLREVRVALAELECVYAKVTNAEMLVADSQLHPYFNRIRKQLRASVEETRDAMYFLLEKESAFLQEKIREKEEDDKWFEELCRKHSVQLVSDPEPEVIDLSGRKV